MINDSDDKVHIIGTRQQGNKQRRKRKQGEGALDAKLVGKYFDKCRERRVARQTGRKPSKRFDSERREETGERLSASAWDIAGHPFPPMTRGFLTGLSRRD